MGWSDGQRLYPLLRDRMQDDRDANFKDEGLIVTHYDIIEELGIEGTP